MIELPLIRLTGRGAHLLRTGRTWLFAEQVASAPELSLGTMVDALDEVGAFVARGFYNGASKIRFRRLLNVRQDVHADFIAERLVAAEKKRRGFIDVKETNSYRLVFSEGDDLPGLIVDRYDEWLVVAFNCAGMDALREPVLEALRKVWNPRGILERSSPFAREQDGLPARLPTDCGPEDVPAEVEIRENGLRWLCDLRGGQKTGFYFDHRDNRRRFAAHCTGRDVLDVCCGAGAFGGCALAAGADSVTLVDSSAAMLERAERNLRLNDLFDARRVQLVCADVFKFLETAPRRRFGAVTVDPPAFAKSRSLLAHAEKAYRRLYRSAAALPKEDGILGAASCSGPLSASRFRDLLRGVSRFPDCRLKILKITTGSADHPFAPDGPAGRYLKYVLGKMRAQKTNGEEDDG